MPLTKRVIVSTSRGKGKSPRLTSSQRARIILRARGRCVICRYDFDPDLLDVHHIIPLSKGGSNRPRDTLVLCPTCHREVHARKTPVSRLRSLKKPRTSANKKRVSGTVRCSDCRYLYRDFGAGPYMCKGNGVLNSFHVSKPRSWKKCRIFSPTTRAKLRYRRRGKGWEFL